MQENSFCIQFARFLWKKKFIFIARIMTTFAISADIRTQEEKVSHLRKSKKVPGVVYGKTQEPISLTFDASELLKLYRKAGESNIIDLKVGKKELEVLVHQSQRHPVTGEFTHIDFYAITRWEVLQTKVSLNFTGEAEAVKEGAIVDEIIKEIEVKCMPRNLVDHFNVDLSLLKEVGDAIRISDLGLDLEKYELLIDIEETVAIASAPKVEVVEEVVEEVVTGSDEDVQESEEKETSEWAE